MPWNAPPPSVKTQSGEKVSDGAPRPWLPHEAPSVGLSLRPSWPRAWKSGASEGPATGRQCSAGLSGPPGGRGRGGTQAAGGAEWVPCVRSVRSGGNLSADPLGGKVAAGFLSAWCPGEVGLPKGRGDPGSLLSRPGPRRREGVHRLGTGAEGLRPRRLRRRAGSVVRPEGGPSAPCHGAAPVSSRQGGQLPPEPVLQEGARGKPRCLS